MVKFPLLKNKGEKNANNSDIRLAYGPGKCMHKESGKDVVVLEGLA